MDRVRGSTVYTRFVMIVFNLNRRSEKNPKQTKLIVGICLLMIYDKTLYVLIHTTHVQ